MLPEPTPNRATMQTFGDDILLSVMGYMRSSKDQAAFSIALGRVDLLAESKRAHVAALKACTTVEGYISQMTIEERLYMHRTVMNCMSKNDDPDVGTYDDYEEECERYVEMEMHLTRRV
eukprot:scaffold17932_cov126-Isochrysis_galbana.AAC.2